jgi:hypothetical protein
MVCRHVCSHRQLGLPSLYRGETKRRRAGSRYRRLSCVELLRAPRSMRRVRAIGCNAEPVDDFQSA